MESIVIGNRFGELVVLGRSGVDDNGNRLWLCQCGCGKTAKVSTSDLRQGRRRSCGCLRQETRKGRRKRDGHTAALDRFLYPGRSPVMVK